MAHTAIGKINKPVAINVLHVRSTIGMYGAEKVLLNLMGEFKKSIYNTKLSVSVSIIEGISEQSQNLALLLKKQGLPHESIVSKKRLDLSAVKQLYSTMKHKKISVIHTHDYKSLLFMILATLFSNKKIIHHIHGALGNTKAERIYAFIERICMVRANQIITVSKNQKDIIAGYPYIKNKVIQVNNGTVLPSNAVQNDTKENHTQKNSEPFTLVMVARFTPEKNHKLALDVLNELKIHKTNKPVQLILLGDGPNNQAIKNQMDEYGLQESIKLVGFTNDVQSWLKKADLLLITSTTEGMPMCLLEAMALGLPTVSTPVGEISHLLTQSQSGLLASKKEALAQLIITLMENDSLYQEYSRNAQAYSEEHLSVQKQAQELSGIYQRLMNKSGSINT